MKRILLKLSGEALSGQNKEIYDNAFVDSVAATIKSAVDEGFEIALVILTDNSGKLVPTATIVRPIKIDGTFNFFATSLADVTNKSAPLINKNIIANSKC